MPEPFWDVGRSAAAMPIGAEMVLEPMAVIAMAQTLAQQGEGFASEAGSPASAVSKTVSEAMSAC